MNQHDFNKLASSIYEASSKVLQTKSSEYSSDFDRLHNFKRAADFENECPERALRGMLTKHLVSIYDMIEEIDLFNHTTKSLEIWDEKILDALNYFILLRALVAERVSQ